MLGEAQHNPILPASAQARRPSREAKHNVPAAGNLSFALRPEKDKKLETTEDAGDTAPERALLSKSPT
jgi:hypothetical protein